MASMLFVTLEMVSTFYYLSMIIKRLELPALRIIISCTSIVWTVFISDTCTMMEKIRNEEIRARAGVANISDQMRSDTEMVRQCGEKDWRRCSNKNMEDVSGWTPKYGTTGTEVE